MRTFPWTVIALAAACAAIAAVALLCTDVAAENSTPETALPIEGHNYITAHLNATNSSLQYWYQFDLDRGDELFIYFYGTGEPYHRCRMLYSLLGPDSYDNGAYVHGESWYNQRQQYDDYSDLWDWICPATGTYYLHFFAIGTAVGDFHANVSMDRPLTIYRFATDTGTLWWYGITDLNKYDVWKVWLEAQPTTVQGVEVTLTWTGDRNINLEAYDLADSFEQNLLNGSYSMAMDHREVVRFTASYTGWYYIRLNYGNYSAEVDYTLRTAEYSAPNDGDNDPANATLVLKTNVYSGRIEASRDMHDWYRFELDAGDLLGISAQLMDPNHPANNGDTRNFWNLFEIQVYDPYMRRVGNGYDTNYAYPTYATAINNLDIRSTDITLQGMYCMRISFSSSYGWYYDPVNTSAHVIAFCGYTLQITIPNKPPRINATALEDVLMLEDTTWWEDYSGRNVSSVDLGTVFRDPEGGELTFSATGDANVTAKAAGALVTLRPRKDWYGEANVTVAALDDSGNRVTAIFHVTVVPVNDAPRVTVDDMQVPFLEDDPAPLNRTFDLHDLFYDIDPGDDANLTFTMVPHPRVSVVIDNATGNATLASARDFNGELDVTFVAADPAGATTSASVHVVVEPVNDAPLARAEGTATWTLQEGFSLASFDAADLLYDPDGDAALRWNVIYDPPAGRDLLSITNEAKDPFNSAIVIIPATGKTDWYGTVTIILECVDPGRLTGTKQVEVVVENTPDPPIISTFSPPGSVMIKEGDRQGFAITSIIDPDPPMGSPTYVWSVRRGTGPLVEVKNGTDPSYELDTDYKSEGTLVVSVVVRDPTGLPCATPVEWAVTVLKTNRRPTVTVTSPEDNATFKEGQWVELTASGTDPDEEDAGDLTYEWYDGETFLRSGRTMSIKTLTPGEHLITAVVRDPAGGESEATITVVVKKSEDGPGAGALAALAALFLSGLAGASTRARRAPPGPEP
jgi:hypothetical protein